MSIGRTPSPPTFWLYKETFQFGVSFLAFLDGVGHTHTCWHVACAGGCMWPAAAMPAHMAMHSCTHCWAHAWLIEQNPHFSYRLLNSLSLLTSSSVLSVSRLSARQWHSPSLWALSELILSSLSSLFSHYSLRGVEGAVSGDSGMGEDNFSAFRRSWALLCLYAVCCHGGWAGPFMGCVLAAFMPSPSLTR